MPLPIAAKDRAGILEQRILVLLTDGLGNVYDMPGNGTGGLLVQIAVELPAAVVVTAVAADDEEVQLRPAKADRKRLSCYNDSDFALLLKEGAGASAASFTVRIPPRRHWEMPRPCSPGIISGVWEVPVGSPSGNAMITEG